MPTLGHALLWLMLAAPLRPPASPADDPGAYWPGKSWRTSTPEAQGIDSERIAKLLKVLAASDGVHAVVIVRNGWVVTEAYFAPYHRGVPENLVSLGDSIVGALVGIGLRDGLLRDVDQPVLGFFPGAAFRNPSARKRATTVRDLLTMTAGFFWPWNMDAALTGEMLASDDSLRFVLDRPMEANVGTRFNYTSGGSQVLAAILQKTSGQPLAALARARLFEPIGIADFAWSQDRAGLPWASFGLRLSPLDLARFGYLYLRHGEWHGRQVVPGAWIAASTKPQAECHFFPDDTATYGYHWWIEPFGYSARGLSGNALFVLPELDMVVAITGEYRFYSLHANDRYPRAVSFDGEMRDGPTKSYVSELIQHFLVPAVHPGPLPPASALPDLLRSIEQPEPIAPAPLPPLAARLSGRTITLAPNPLRLGSLSLTFDRRSACWLTVARDDGTLATYAVGLDGRFRTTRATNGDERALRGSWTSPRTFALEMQELEEQERLLVEVAFGDGAEVRVDVAGSVSDLRTTLRGRLDLHGSPSP